MADWTDGTRSSRSPSTCLLPGPATWPGFASEEIAPVEAGGETWRRLEVTCIIVPATRRAYDQLAPDHPLMVAIDMGKITIR